MNDEADGGSDHDEGAVSRRALLLGAAAALLAGGAGVAGVEAGVLPGRSRLQHLLGQDGPAGSIPDVEPGPVVSGSFLSKERAGRRTGWSIAYPSAVNAALPVLVVLHGRGGTHASAFGNQLGLDRFLKAGGHQYAIASVDGGDTYWHARKSGEDSGAMVIKEFLPLLAARGLDTRRVGLLGWSMGGFGALWLARQLTARTAAAVCAESPALWHTAAQTADGAFDDAADYTAHDVFAHRAELASIPLRIDCGTNDGFYPAARDYAAGFTPPPAGGFTVGGHDNDYWRRMAPQQLTFIAGHLGAS